jgi:RecA-family ATPase
MIYDYEALDAKELDAAKKLHRRMVTGELNGNAALEAARPPEWTEEAWGWVIQRMHEYDAELTSASRIKDKFAAVDHELPVFRYTWKSGSDNSVPSSFECYSGSRSDADRQALAHFHSLGLSSRITTFAEVQEALVDLDVEVYLDGRIGDTPLPIFDIDLLDGPAPPEQRWALKGFIPAGEVTLWTGGGGVGKSLTAQQMGTCMASALPFLRVATEALTVLYVTAEDSVEVLHRRQLAINDMVAPGHLKGKLHLSSLRGRIGNELCTFDSDGKLVASKTFTALRETIEVTGAQIVFLDNVAHLFTGNENDRGQVTQFVNLLYSLVKDLGVTVVLIAHPNKSGDEFSGSTAWLNAVRSHIHLSHDKISDLLTLATSKANYARKGQEVSFMWWQGAYIHADDVPPDVAREMAENAQAAADNLVFLACLREATERQQTISDKPTASNFAPKIFAKMAESKGIGRDRLDRAMDRLFRARAIERGELPWRGNDRHAAEGLREKVRDGLREGCGLALRDGAGELS